MCLRIDVCNIYIKIFFGCLGIVICNIYIKNFFGVWELAFVMLEGCFFRQNLTPFILRGRNFFISNLFSIIVNVSYSPIEGVQVSLRHYKQ